MSAITENINEAPAVELTPLDKKRPRIYMVLLLFQMLSLLSNMMLVPAITGNDLSNAIACGCSGTRCSCRALVCSAGITHNPFSRSNSDRSACLTDPDRTAVNIKN